MSDAATSAWLAAIPCAVLAAIVALLFGTALGKLVYPTQLSVRFLPADPETITPEPVENARYLILVAAPLLLALATIAITRRASLRPIAAQIVVVAAQAAGMGLIVICFVEQHHALWTYAYFTLATLAAAAAVTVVLVLAARSDQVRKRLRPRVPAQDRRLVHTTLLLMAALLTALWLLPAVNSEGSIAWAFLNHDTAFHFDETFAVINGLTPLVDFNAQYASLFPLGIALSMLTFGKSLLIFTITLCTLSLLVLLAIYGVLRRVTGSAVLGFALYLPFMATSLFATPYGALGRFSPGTYFPMFPLRYGGPYLLAWLLSRHLERERQPALWPLFVASGFVLLNNFEFGVAAFGATVAALLWTSFELSWRYALRFAVSVAAGLGMAVVVMCVFALIRAGSFPQLLKTAQFARLYALAGYSVAPIPGVLGLPLVIYLTYVGAIGVGTVRAINRTPNRVLTGMLVWSGVFGLGSGSYYVARSNFGLLPMTFSAWTLTLALLIVVAMRQLAATGLRRSGIASLAVLFGIGLATCSLAQIPSPWGQIQRIRQPPTNAVIAEAAWSHPPTRDPRVRSFISPIAEGKRFVVRHGAPVAIFATTGHRIADAYGIKDVVPYTGPESIHTVEQLDDSLDALHATGGNTALIPPRYVELLREELERRGFAVLTEVGPRLTAPGAAFDRSTMRVVGGYTKWVDLRHRDAAWLHRHVAGIGRDPP